MDVNLELGTFAEATEVTALAPLTRADSAEMGEVIEERAVRELPLNGRNFATLVYLAPGVTAGQAGENLSGASTFNPRGASNFNALGSQANANAWLVDGIDNNGYTFNTVIVTPSVERPSSASRTRTSGARPPAASRPRSRTSPTARCSSPQRLIGERRRAPRGGAHRGGFGGEREGHRSRSSIGGPSGPPEMKQAAVAV